jgi:colanic acid/amylovoran biosynthesis glycosyltransferase
LESSDLKVAFIYATFPRPTETFVRRELRSLIKIGFKPDIYSIWQGHNDWEGNKVFRFSLWNLMQLLYWIPYWAWATPQSFLMVLKHIFGNPCPGFQNWNETFFGFAFGLVRARDFQSKNYQRIHAVWATMPATAAYIIHLLTEIPYSFGAHAYDVFRYRGDWLLPLKLERAKFVRTSSESTAKRLRLLGLENDKINLIRRSLTEWPQRSNFSLHTPCQLSLLAVGRLVPKKGYFHLLKIAKLLDQTEIPFHLSVVGSGPLGDDLALESKRFGLSTKVSFLGPKSESELQEIFLSHDCLLFTGIIDNRGDRDGTPNVILESMAAGLLILASNKAGAMEAFDHLQSGFSLDPASHKEWVQLLQDFYRDPARFEKIRQFAMQQAREKFDSEHNAGKIRDQFFH